MDEKDFYYDSDEVLKEELEKGFDFEEEDENLKGMNLKGKILGAYSGLKEKAENLLKDDEKMEGFLRNVETTLNRIPVERIPKVGPMLKNEFPLGDVAVMLSLVRSYFLKKYTDVSKSNVIIATICMLYLINPFDIIPDYIPVLGWIDDAIVVTVLANLLDEELERYKEWREEQEKFIDAEIVIRDAE